MAAMEPSVEKPEELVLLETLLALGLQPRSGGYFDQPWLLMKSMEAAAAGKAMYQVQPQHGENK